MILQLLVNGIVAGSIYFLVALGFALVYQTMKFLNFSHAVVFACGAYFALILKERFGLNLFLSVPVSIVLCMTVGCLIDFLVFRQLRKKDSSANTKFIASLGIYIALQNVLSTVFGDNMRTIRSGKIKEGLHIGSAIITPLQIHTLVAAIGLMVLVVLVLKFTTIGITLRAIANSPKLAQTVGINGEKVFLWTFMAGAGLAAVAGVLVSLDIDMTPTMGMRPLLMGIIAMIIGGISSIPGITLGVLLLGMSQQFGAWYLGSQWQDAIAFIILVIFLLFKPEGFFGKKPQTATV